jgi:hypothetical protein
LETNDISDVAATCQKQGLVYQDASPKSMRLILTTVWYAADADTSQQCCLSNPSLNGSLDEAMACFRSSIVSTDHIHGFIFGPISRDN